MEWPYKDNLNSHRVFIYLCLDQLVHKYNQGHKIKVLEVQLDTLQNLWMRAVFMTLVNISLSYQKMINIP